MSKLRAPPPKLELLEVDLDSRPGVASRLKFQTIVGVDYAFEPVRARRHFPHLYVLLLHPLPVDISPPRLDAHLAPLLGGVVRTAQEEAAACIVAKLGYVFQTKRLLQRLSDHLACLHRPQLVLEKVREMPMVVVRVVVKLRATSRAPFPLVGWKLVIFDELLNLGSPRVSLQFGDLQQEDALTDVGNAVGEDEVRVPPMPLAFSRLELIGIRDDPVEIGRAHV